MMSDNSQSPVGAEKIDRIIRAAGLEVAADPETTLKLAAILGRTVSEMIRMAPSRKALTRKEMERVEKLHDRFDSLLRSFQGTGNPPPMLPTVRYESGVVVTEWQRWLYALRFHEPTRQKSLNWRAVGELLVLYEMIFETRVTAENAESGATRPVCLLKAAFAAVKEHVPKEQERIAPYYYIVPSVSSLNSRLGELRTREMKFAEHRIREMLSDN